MPPDREDILYEIAGGIGRIEGKLDGMIEADKESRKYFADSINNLAGSINKIVMTLIAIIAAQIGVEFMPNSPIDWNHALMYSSMYMIMFCFFFLSARLLQTHKHRNKEKFLAYGLLLMAITFVLVMIVPNTPIYIIVSIRIIYASLLTYYAWNLECPIGIYPPDEITPKSSLPSEDSYEELIDDENIERKKLTEIINNRNT